MRLIATCFATLLVTALFGNANAADCRDLLFESFDPLGIRSQTKTEFPYATFAENYTHYDSSGQPYKPGHLNQESLQYDLKFQPPESIDYPISTLLRKSGLGLARLQEMFSIPKKLRRFYDRENGTFTYQSGRQIELQPENGDRPIELIRLNFRKEYAEIYQLFLKDLQQALTFDPNLQIVILYARGSKQTLDKLIQNTFEPSMALRVETKPVKTEDLIEIYAQDDSKPSTGGILVRANLEYSDVTRHAQPYESAMNALENQGQRTTSANVYFHGGDIIVGKRHLFIGKNLINLAQKRLHISQAEAIRMFEVEFGKKVFMVGAKVAKELIIQMDFDADFTLAIVRDKSSGKETVLLSSAEKTMEILKKKFKGVKTPKSLNGADLSEWRLFKELEQLDFSARALHNQEIIKRLLKEGYDVIEIPYFSLSRNEQFSYANMIPSDQYVLLPEFGYPALDNSMQQTISQLGYQVLPVKSAKELAKLRAGPHCLTCSIRDDAD